LIYYRHKINLDFKEEKQMSYLMEKWPTSNKRKGVFYDITIRKNGKILTQRFDTVEDVESAVQQIRFNKWPIVRARRFCRGSWEDFTPETAAEKTKRENENHCECIALELEGYAAGEYYACPDCGEAIYLTDEVGDKYKCPSCGSVNDTDDFEQLGLLDYLRDVYDVEYRIGGDREYRNVRLMVACGGPNIYIDTHAQKVQLYWSTDYAEYHLIRSVCDEIDALWEELFICS
jgi:predicted RNA-binding Zn-ribbon protein involved in translation (DUF1610 family)